MTKRQEEFRTEREKAFDDLGIALNNLGLFLKWKARHNMVRIRRFWRNKREKK